jgi:hypothetical protein
MTSKISWLDFSDSDRRKMIEVVSFFKQRDTRDELGLAQIRDGFAEMFFPGTTTLQTRARYFLFVPWLYRYNEARHTPSAKISERIRTQEIQLMGALSKSGDTDGVIGRRSGASLHRFPSSIYWNGLRAWGILHFPGTQYQYHRSLDRYYQRFQNMPEIETGELVRDEQSNWDPNLPLSPDGFPNEVSFQLSNEEADYLREHLVISCSQSLLSHMVDRCDPVEETSFAWLHPQFAEFPAYLKDRLTHARNFSETLQGATLLYNLLLAEKRESDELITRYRERIGSWMEQMHQREASLLSWDRHNFWKLTDGFGPVSYLNRIFVDAWLDRLFSEGEIRDPIEHGEMRRIVYDREVWLKRNRSRLENPRHLELWGGDSGTGQLAYRWGVGNRLAIDIQRGLKEG